MGGTSISWEKLSKSLSAKPPASRNSTTASDCPVAVALFVMLYIQRRNVGVIISKSTGVRLVERERWRKFFPVRRIGSSVRPTTSSTWARNDVGMVQPDTQSSYTHPNQESRKDKITHRNKTTDLGSGPPAAGGGPRVRSESNVCQAGPPQLRQRRARAGCRRGRAKW